MHERCRHCRGCGGDRSEPEPATKIQELEPGQCIIIRKGFGVPEAPDDFETVVADVSGNSFLTTDGTRLDCNDVDGFSVLDKPKAKVVLSARAKEVMRATAPTP